MDEELMQLVEGWEKLPVRIRGTILVLAGIRDSVDRRGVVKRERTKKGETPGWLVLALNILRDSGRYLSDREIARRVGVSQSQLSRSRRYQHARETYLQPVRKVVRRGIVKSDAHQ